MSIFEDLLDKVKGIFNRNSSDDDLGLEEDNVDPLSSPDPLSPSAPQYNQNPYASPQQPPFQGPIPTQFPEQPMNQQIPGSQPSTPPYPQPPEEYPGSMSPQAFMPNIQMPQQNQDIANQIALINAKLETINAKLDNIMQRLSYLEQMIYRR